MMITMTKLINTPITSDNYYYYYFWWQTHSRSTFLANSKYTLHYY